jgi:hypothetical protein
LRLECRLLSTSILANGNTLRQLSLLWLSSNHRWNISLKKVPPRWIYDFPINGPSPCRPWTLSSLKLNSQASISNHILLACQFLDVPMGAHGLSCARHVSAKLDSVSHKLAAAVLAWSLRFIWVFRTKIFVLRTSYLGLGKSDYGRCKSGTALCIGLQDLTRYTFWLVFRRNLWRGRPRYPTDRYSRRTRGANTHYHNFNQPRYLVVSMHFGSLPTIILEFPTATGGIIGVPMLRKYRGDILLSFLYSGVVG